MTKKSKPTYSQRIAVLRSLGFDSYNHYLSSELWAEIRDVVLDRDGGNCKVCNEKAVIVHHIDYSKSTLCGDSFDSLVSLCHRCHRKIEFSKDGKKRTLVQAMVSYRAVWIKRTSRKNRNRCVSCGSSAKRNSTMCRPCLKQFNKTQNTA